MSLLGLVERASEFISLCGGEGVEWSDVVAVIPMLTSRIQLRVRECLTRRSFVFHQSEDTQQGSEGSLKVFAPEYEIYSRLGITSPLEVPPDAVLNLLQLIGKSGARGLLISEVSELTNLNFIHSIVDKLVVANLVIKTSIAPDKNAHSPRYSCRTTVLHLPRFVSLYDPSEDGMCITGDDHFETMHNYICNLLENRENKRIPIRDLFRPLRYRDISSLCRNLILCQAHMKDRNRIDVVSSDLSTTSGSFDAVISYVTLKERAVDENDEDDGERKSRTLFGMGIIEQAAYRLGTAEGRLVPSTELRRLVGITRKQTEGVIKTLVKANAAEMQLRQLGRQRVFALSAPPLEKRPSTLFSGCSLSGDMINADENAVDESCISGKSSGIVTIDSESLRELRRRVVLEVLRKCGGITESLTCGKEISKAYASVNAGIQLCAKTVQRLFQTLSEERVVVQLDNVPYCGNPLKIIHTPELENVTVVLEEYLRVLTYAKKSRKSMVDCWTGRESADDFFERTREIDENNNNDDSENEQEFDFEPADESSSSHFDHIDWHIEDQDPWRCERLSTADEIDKRIMRTEGIECLRYVTSLPSTQYVSDRASVRDYVEDGVNGRHASDILTDNATFLARIMGLHVTLVKQGSRYVTEFCTGRHRGAPLVYTFTVVNALERLPVRVVAKRYGFPPDYVNFVERKSDQFPNLTKTDKVLLQAIKNSTVSLEYLLSHPMSTVSNLAKRMLSHAYQSFILEFIALVSLGIVEVPLLSRDDSSNITEKVLVENVYFTIALRPVLCKRTLHTEKEVTGYWNSVVMPHVEKVLNESVVPCLQTAVTRQYSTMFPQSFKVDELPPLDKTDSKCRGKREKKRKRQSKNKRSKRRALSHDAYYQEADAMRVAVWEYFKQRAIHLPPVLQENMPGVPFGEGTSDKGKSDSGGNSSHIGLVDVEHVASSASSDPFALTYEWHHPYRQLLRSNYEDLDILEAFLPYRKYWKVGRILCRRLPQLLGRYCTLRKALAKILSSLDLSHLENEIVPTDWDSQYGDEARRQDSSEQVRRRGQIAEVLNDVIDTDRYYEASMRTGRRVEHAAMTRTLQIYTSQNRVLKFFLPTDSTDAVDETAEEEENVTELDFRRDAMSLLEFPLEVAIRSHRELYGKKWITRHTNGNKGKTSLNKFKLEKRFSHPLTTGITGIFGRILQTSTEEGICSAPPVTLAPHNHVSDTSDVMSPTELLAILHVFASSGGIFDRAVLNISNCSRQKEGGDTNENGVEGETLRGHESTGFASVSMGARLPPDAHCCILSDDSRRGDTHAHLECRVCSHYEAETCSEETKRRCCTRIIKKPLLREHVGNLSTLLNKVWGEIDHCFVSTPRSNVDSSRKSVVASACDLSSADGDSIADLARTVLNLCGSIDGASLEEIVAGTGCAYSRERIVSYVDMASKQGSLLCVPHYDMYYTYQPFYILPKYRALYFIGDWQGSSGEERYKPHPDERLCPWLQLNGTRNIPFYDALRSRVVSTLITKPNCTISTIHANLPMLSCTHMCIFLDCLVREKTVIERRCTNDTVLENVFDEPGVSSADTPFTSYSISPEIWM
mmetsp:Transcript_15452/g.23325  ORF Transcript_15452/g.23325 Transcript_15452/m.23325 type:complete len:1583 (-) Transcript_15452:334-5082(-)